MIDRDLAKICRRLSFSPGVAADGTFGSHIIAPPYSTSLRNDERVDIMIANVSCLYILQEETNTPVPLSRLIVMQTTP